MVKTVLSVAHSGLREWKLQRLTAIILALYSIWLLTFVISHSGLSFAEWHALFANDAVRVATIIAIVSVLYHAWIGMWTIYTDYVKCFIIRCVLEVLTIIMLIACFFWGFLILWSL